MDISTFLYHAMHEHSVHQFGSTRHCKQKRQHCDGHADNYNIKGMHAYQ